MKRILSIFVLIVSGFAAQAATITEQQKITMLLDALDTPGITFIRNGESHDGAWAKHHLAQKLKKASPAITTANDFITKIASTSSHSGKPYLIQTKDGKPVEAATWFQDKLSDLPSRAADDNSK